MADLTNAMASTLAAIPPLVAALAPSDPIQAYIDLNPANNNVDRAIYEMQPGQLLVVWRDTVVTQGEMSRYNHVVHICARALPDASNLDLLDLIMTGVPVPGDGLPWLYCGLLPNLYPTVVTRAARDTDSEGVDYVVVETETAEMFGWPLPGLGG